MTCGEDGEIGVIAGTSARVIATPYRPGSIDMHSPRMIRSPPDRSVLDSNGAIKLAL